MRIKIFPHLLSDIFAANFWVVLLMGKWLIVMREGFGGKQQKETDGEGWGRIREKEK